MRGRPGQSQGESTGRQPQPRARLLACLCISLSHWDSGVIPWGSGAKQMRAEVNTLGPRLWDLERVDTWLVTPLSSGQAAVAQSPGEGTGAHTERMPSS